MVLRQPRQRGPGCVPDPNVARLELSLNDQDQVHDRRLVVHVLHNLELATSWRSLPHSGHSVVLRTMQESPLWSLPRFGFGQFFTRESTLRQITTPAFWPKSCHAGSVEAACFRRALST